VRRKEATTNADNDAGKREPLFIVGGRVNWSSHYGNQYGGSSKSIN
jgi:hypothetical protein